MDSSRRKLTIWWVVHSDGLAAPHIDHLTRPRPLLLPNVEIGGELISSNRNVNNHKHRFICQVSVSPVLVTNCFVKRKTAPLTKIAKNVKEAVEFGWLVWHQLVDVFLRHKRKKEGGSRRGTMAFVGHNAR